MSSDSRDTEFIVTEWAENAERKLGDTSNKAKTEQPIAGIRKRDWSFVSDCFICILKLHIVALSRLKHKLKYKRIAMQNVGQWRKDNVIINS